MNWKQFQFFSVVFVVKVGETGAATCLIMELLAVTKCVQPARVAGKETARHCLELRLFSVATFEPIQLYIICLTANQ